MILSLVKPAARGLARAALLSMTLLSWSVAHSQSLGTYGNVWGIAEADAIDAIKGKLSQMERSGEMRKLWEDYRDRYLAAIENPAPLPGISTARESRVRTFDPTFTFGEDFEDQNGRVLVKAGTRVNPLDYTPLTKTLIFIDGRDPEQVAFAKSRTDTRPLDKVILVAGSFLKLNREWGRPTYFDQRGHLSTKLGIKRVPAVVSQKGNLLQIEEIALGGKNR
jgi:conjugal transfer pilus assembly protein TraW